MDGPTGEKNPDLKSPPKKSKPEASTSSSRTKKPYLEKEERSQFRDAAAIAKDQDPHAVYHAAYTSIGKINKDISYMMRKMKHKPGLAKEARIWYQKRRKNKGIIIVSLIRNKMCMLHEKI